MLEADGGLDADGALAVLIRSQLLAAEARRRGFDATAEVQDARHRALARVVVEKKIGEAVTAETLDQDKLKEFYKAQKRRFVHGVQRRVVHFLAKTGKKGMADQEALALAEKAQKTARDIVNEEDFISELGAIITKAHRGKVLIEKLPPIDKENKRLVRSFVDAVFAVGKVPGVSRPVKTKFGWHVIFVAEQLPAESISFEEARATLSSEVLPEEKKYQASVMLEKLEKQGDVFIIEEALTSEGLEK
jgi:hypothetical protein